MKLIFAGTPEFAACALQALMEAGHEIALVLTQPDRPAGRGLQPTPSPVKVLGLRLGLQVTQPQTLKGLGIQADLARIGADALVVAAYGLILPKAVLEIPRFGCINIHASLLPRWRGAAPIQRALLAGDSHTGITIMKMDEGLDTGPILLQQCIPISDEDTAQTLHDKLATLGAQCIVRALSVLPEGRLEAKPQAENGVTYAAKIDKAEALIDWRKSADEIWRAVRAFDPFPGATSSLNGIALKLWRVRPEPGVSGTPGEVLEAGPAGIVVACGEGALRLEILQKPGGKKLSTAQFILGFPVRPGDRFTDA